MAIFLMSSFFKLRDFPGSTFTCVENTNETGSNSVTIDILASIWKDGQLSPSILMKPCQFVFNLPQTNIESTNGPLKGFLQYRS